MKFMKLKFMTDFLRRFKWSRRRSNGIEDSINDSIDNDIDSKGIEGSAPKEPDRSESQGAPQDTEKKPKKWKMNRPGVAGVVGVVLLGLLVWCFLPSKPVPPQTQPKAGELAPLSPVEKELFQAVRDDDVDAIRRCLDLGANANAVDMSGVTPIKAAIALNRTKAVRALLDGGYDDSDGSSLIYAIVQNRPEILQELLKSAIKGGTARKIVNQVDKNGCTPLMYAIDRNHVAIAQALLNAGANVNGFDKEGHTPLMMAVTVGKADMVAALLTAGAQVDAVSRGGETAVSIARRRNKQVVVSLLVEAEKTRVLLPPPPKEI
jgi:hypothetical protein